MKWRQNDAYKDVFSGGEKSKIKKKERKTWGKVRGEWREARSYDPKSMPGKYLTFF